MQSGRSGGVGNPRQDYFYDHVRLAPFAVLISVKLAQGKIQLIIEWACGFAEWYPASAAVGPAIRIGTIRIRSIGIRAIQVRAIRSRVPRVLRVLQVRDIEL